jgi:hypothetical protein
VRGTGTIYPGPALASSTISIRMTSNREIIRIFTIRCEGSIVYWLHTSQDFPVELDVVDSQEAIWSCCGILNLHENIKTSPGC